MENFLRELHEAAKSNEFGYQKDQMQIWYNPDGDCLQFQADHVAVIGDRIDDYLTIYRSAETNEPIGFQLKDVMALISKYYYDGIIVKADVDKGKLVCVTALLVRLLSESRPSIIRKEGYTEALESLRILPKESDCFIMPRALANA